MIGDTTRYIDIINTNIGINSGTCKKKITVARHKYQNYEMKKFTI
jgi:hypothetical protein